MFVGSILVLCWQTCPSSAQQQEDHAKGPIVYATKDIAPGSILSASDVGKNEIAQSKIPGKAIPSPLLAVGHKAKNKISKNQLIFSQDIDFQQPLSDKEQQIAKEQLKIALKKWNSEGDLYWYRSSKQSSSGRSGEKKD